MCYAKNKKKTFRKLRHGVSNVSRKLEVWNIKLVDQFIPPIKINILQLPHFGHWGKEHSGSTEARLNWLMLICVLIRSLRIEKTKQKRPTTTNNDGWPKAGAANNAQPHNKHFFFNSSSTVIGSWPAGLTSRLLLIFAQTSIRSTTTDHPNLKFQVATATDWPTIKCKSVTSDSLTILRWKKKNRD